MADTTGGVTEMSDLSDMEGAGAAADMTGAGAAADTVDTDGTADMPEQRYNQALQIIDEALIFGVNPSLDGISKMMQKMGNPHLKYPSIQIAGTNGKTSTVRQTAALLRGAGYKTGLYTSPHLVEYPERIEIDGKICDKSLFADAVLEAKRVADELQDMVITEFELLTAAAFWAFAKAGIDVAVLECGMGGRWDATSIVNSDVAVVTGIGLDHLGVLGNTQEEIACEKAAIIHESCKAVLGPGTQSTLHVFQERANEVGARPWLVKSKADAASTKFDGASGFVTYACKYGDEPGTICVDVTGIYATYDQIIMHAPLYQAQNIATAIAATELYVGHALDVDNVRLIMKSFAIPGRFETLCKNPYLIIDAAHNPQSALNLATAVARKFPQGDFQLLLAVLADKDAHGIIEALAGLTPDIAVTQTSSLRALTCFELADMVEEMTGTRPEIFENPKLALDELMLRQVNTIASGSITLAGEIKGAWLERSR